MKAKTKSAIILVSVLLLGVVLGGLAHRPLFRMHLRKSPAFSHPGSIRRIVERKLRPTAEQRKQIRPIIARHEKSIRAMHKNHQKEIIKMMDSLKADLKPLLTPEQISRLDWKKMGRRGKPGRRDGRDYRRRRPGKGGMPGKDGWNKQGTNRQWEKFGGGFAERLTDMIKPDDTQKDTIMAIIKKHTDMMPQKKERPLSGKKSILENIRADLEPLLTPEQLERLDQKIEKMPSRRGAPQRTGFSDSE